MTFLGVVKAFFIGFGKSHPALLGIIYPDQFLDIS